MKQILLPVFAWACCLMASAQQIKITAGTFFINNNATVTFLNTDFNNDGSAGGLNGTIVFAGSNHNNITGNGSTSFHNVQLSKQAGSKLILQKDISASGTVVFNGGFIDLGNQQFELKFPGGLLQNETENSRIIANGTGEVFITQTLSAPNNSNPGNLGVTITSQNNLGTTTIRRGHKPQTSNMQQQSIRRYFQIEPANNTNIYVNLHFSYFDAELNNLLETNCSLFEKTGTADWKALSADGISMLYNYREKSGLTSLNRYTMFSAVQGPLPLTLLAFDVSCKDGDAKLQWITANEVNTKQFTIEKSNDGIHWQTSSAVPSKGNTSQHTYSELVPANASFFRLKMEDADGKFTYSPVKKIDCNNAQKLMVGPNPTSGNVTISATVNTPKLLTISVVDMSGRMILSKPWQVKQGLNSELIDLYRQPSSTYLVIVKGEGVNEMIKIIKQ